MSTYVSRAIAFSISACGLLLASCSGSGGNIVPPQGTAAAPNVPGSTQTSTAQHIYVGNLNGRSALAYDVAANGNVPPLFTITGPTGCNFSGPVTGVAVDSSDILYIADAAGGFIDMYQLSNGVSPSFVGDFPVTAPYQIALDSSNNLYVANQDGAISKYARGPSGTFSRVAEIVGPATQLGGATVTYGVSVDAAGEVFAAVSGSETAINDRILVFGPHANGNVAPIRQITGPHTLLSAPFQIAVSAAGQLYVSNFIGTSATSPGVTVYAPGATGDVAPIADITGSNTTLEHPNGVAVDASGKIYVADGTQALPPGPGVHNEIAVFAPGANGNVAPMAVISGSNTGLAGPGAVTIH